MKHPVTSTKSKVKNEHLETFVLRLWTGNHFEGTYTLNKEPTPGD